MARAQRSASRGKLRGHEVDGLSNGIFHGAEISTPSFLAPSMPSKIQRIDPDAIVVAQARKLIIPPAVLMRPMEEEQACSWLHIVG